MRTTTTRARGGPPPRPALRSAEEVRQLVEENRGLVSYMLKRMHLDCHPEADDLYQAGMMGLMRGAELFDESLGFRFSTFATRWIQQRIGRALARASLVPPPAGADRKKRDSMPSVVGLADMGDERSRQRGAYDLADDAPSPADLAEADERAEVVEQLLCSLPARWAQVLRLRFLDGKTLAEVGERMGFCRERARQLEARALARLKCQRWRLASLL